MGIHADLGRALAAAAATAPRVRFAAPDPDGGPDLTGEVTSELSDTHVRLRCDDGRALPVARADLRLLCHEGRAP